MSIWKDFESDCTDYLNDRFGAYAKFIHQGGSDSTVPDILVKPKTRGSFYIDAKHSPAQCGQFVLTANKKTNTFEYSPSNANRINTSTSMIMNYMNHSFDEYCEAGTAGKEIDMPNSKKIFSDWVYNTYKSKGVRYFITNNYTLFPIERFREYFHIMAKYRIKRSGSSKVGKKQISSVLDYISNLNYIISNERIDGGKLFVCSPQNLHNEHFKINSQEYMFSRRNKEYEIRKLSNTYNANVIFSITQKGNKPGMSDADFISDLQ